MIINCKKCGKDMSNNVTQMWINELILSGKTYIHSDGTEAKYKEVKIKTIKVDYNPPSVDTINDLRKIRLIFKKNKL